MGQYRQGDVLIVRVMQVPIEVKKEENCILAYGEVTGHKHEIEDGAMMYTDSDGKKYVEVYSNSATVVHPEHGSIELEKGNYQITIQREYSPEEIRNVTD